MSQIRHTEIINRIIRARGYESYLEIGLGNGVNFNRVGCSDKTGVDPKIPARADEAEGLLIRAESDAFFRAQTRQFDFIFVDGLHHHQQVMRDIIHALEHLAPGGTILVHDCNPPNEMAQRVPRQSKVWTGDVWKAWVELRANPRLEQICIAEDYGCGVLRPGEQKPMGYVPLHYNALEANRAEWLNLISWEEYENLHL